MDVLDELGDLDRARVVTLSHTVASKTCLSMRLEHPQIQVTVLTHQFINQRDQGLKVFLDGQMEDVSVLDIDGNCKESDIVVERGTLTCLLFMT